MTDGRGKNLALPRVGTILRVGVGIGLLVYLSLSGAIKWSALLNLGSLWPGTLAGLALLLMDCGISGYRLCLLLRPRGLHLSLAGSMRLTLIGQFFNSCLPGSAGGDLVRIYYAVGGNVRRKTEVATVMLLDRAVGMFALLIFPVVVLPWFPQVLETMDVIPGLIGGGALLAAMLLCGMVLAFSERVRSSRHVARVLSRLPFREHVERMCSTVSAYRENKATLLGVVLLSIVIHGLATGIMLILAAIMNTSGFAWEMALLIPLGMLANSLPLSPGGIGIGEAAFESLFRLAGLTGGAEILLGWRLLTLLVGFIGLGFYLQGQKSLIADQLFESQAGESSAPSRAAEARAAR